jgi:hypothetical protein
MKIYLLGAALIVLTLNGCKPRTFNTISSTNAVVAQEFELSNDPQPDKDFGEPTTSTAKAVDFEISTDTKPDSDFL